MWGQLEGFCIDGGGGGGSSSNWWIPAKSGPLLDLALTQHREMTCVGDRGEPSQ